MSTSESNPDRNPKEGGESPAESRDPRILLQRNADLAFLPEERRRHLREITERICQTVPLDWLILFGSHARDDWVEDHDTGYYSDYDLLVIPSEPFLQEHTLLWSRLERELNALTDPIPVTLLVHTIQEVNGQLRKGQYFFTDIVKEGVALLDANRTSLASPPTLIPPELRLQYATYDLNYWYGSANEFWLGSGFYLARGKNTQAAFLLHQSVERYCNALILVYTNYKYRSHDIEKLIDKSAALHPAVGETMPRGDPADHDRFELLKRAYIDARYCKSYRIGEEDLTLLRGQVHRLAQQVLAASREKLESFLGVEAVGALPEVPAYDGETALENLPELDGPEAIERWSRLLMEQGEARGEVRGEARGEARGEIRGRKVGLEEGREEGARLKAVQIARAMLGNGIELETVVKLTGLSETELGG